MTPIEVKVRAAEIASGYLVGASNPEAGTREDAAKLVPLAREIEAFLKEENTS
jgi:hypothetical protein